jgi:hypothetical protein
MARQEKKEAERLSREELDQLDGVELPEREAMSILPLADVTGPSMLPPLVPAIEDEETPE